MAKKRTAKRRERAKREYKYWAWEVFSHLFGPGIMLFAFFSGIGFAEKAVLFAIGVLLFLILNPEILGLD